MRIRIDDVKIAINYAKGMKEAGGSESFDAFIDTAISALKKQIPKETHSEKYCEFVCCNGHYLPRLVTDARMPYCPYCGQLLKYWSDNE